MASVDFEKRQNRGGYFPSPAPLAIIFLASADIQRLEGFGLFSSARIHHLGCFSEVMKPGAPVMVE